MQKVPYLFSDRIIVTNEFIERNKLQLIRTKSEIEQYIEENDDDFEATKDVLTEYLEDDKDIKEAVQDFLDYMNFAWDKALNERNLSATRSILKLCAWMWLLNREDIDDILNNSGGKCNSVSLMKACYALGIDYPDELHEFSHVPRDIIEGKVILCERHFNTSLMDDYPHKADLKCSGCDLNICISHSYDNYCKNCYFG